MKRLLLILAIICFKNGLYAIGKVDPNEQFLQDVINEKHAKVAACLKNNSVDINTVDEFGQTALILAVRGQDEEMVKILLYYLPNINQKDDKNKTAIYYAKKLKDNDFDVVGLLKRYKSKMSRASVLSAPVALSSIESLKPLQAIKHRNLELKRAIREKNIRMLDLLLDYYAKEHQLYLEPQRKPKNLLNSKEQMELDLELDKLIKDGDKAKIIELVKTYRAEIVSDPEEQKKLRLLLRDAIKFGDKTQIIKLIMGGADIDFVLKKHWRSDDNITPLVDSDDYGNLEIFQLLLDFGANPCVEQSIRMDINIRGGGISHYNLRLDSLEIYQKKQEVKKLLEHIKPIKIDEIKKALDLANWPKDVANIVCEY